MDINILHGAESVAPSRKEFSFSSMLSVGSGFKLFFSDAVAWHNEKDKYGKKYIKGMGNIWIRPAAHNRD